MISKRQFLDSCLQEISIIKHLYGKVKPEMLGYRPADKQRTMLELLQYLSHFVKLEAGAIYSGKAIGNFQDEIKAAYQMPADKFLERMDDQAKTLTDIFKKISDGELAQEVDLFGRGKSQPRSLWFFNLILKNLVGYKMQLFLYLKACGVSHIGTSNLWRGEDAKT